MSNPDWRRGVRSILVDLNEVAEVAGTKPPADGAYPWVQTLWDLTEAEALHGDGRTQWTSTDLQLDLWERVETEDGSVGSAIKAALDGVKVEGVRLRFSNAQRILEPDESLVHTVIVFSHNAPFAS